MNTTLLEETAKELTAPGKGILAADESTGSANKRFEAVSVEGTEENRRLYRYTLLSTPDAEKSISGVIFYDETFWQHADDGTQLSAYVSRKGILPGIKVDEGLVELPGFPGEKITKGLDTLPERIVKYRDAGAKFAKWRAVIAIGQNSSDGQVSIPSDECITANAFVLARYARICQDVDIVPIVEPEVLFDGTHTPEQCEAITAKVYDALFLAMRSARVHLPGAILKTGMVLPGKESGIAMDAEDVSTRTVRVLHAHVPHELGGVVFLSGGQTPKDAFLNLNKIAQKGPHPWGLTFSFSRALQDPVLKYWAGNQADIAGAQKIFAEQLSVAVASRDGVLNVEAQGGEFVSGSQDL